MFVGLIKCADCGCLLRYQIKRNKRKDGSETSYGTFMCGQYARSGKDACTAHIIRESIIIETVLADIHKNAAIAAMDERRTADAIIRMRNTESTTRLALNKSELKNITTRL